MLRLILQLDVLSAQAAPLPVPLVAVCVHYVNRVHSLLAWATQCVLLVPQVSIPLALESRHVQVVCLGSTT